VAQVYAETVQVVEPPGGWRGGVGMDVQLVVADESSD